MGRVARIMVLVLVVVLAGLVAQPAWAAPPLPSSMAAIGDSITRAYDVCCSYGDHPGQSWSTGSTSYDGIASHYERIKQLNPAITGHAYNDALSGAKMAAAPTQAAKAVSQGTRYVTILLGANDLCTSSPSTMTSTDTFRTQFSQAMATLMAQDRDPYVFVSSIPNLYQLWEVLHTNSLARWVWATANICQSMLGRLVLRPNASWWWTGKWRSTRSWPRSVPSTHAAGGTTGPSTTSSSAPARLAPWTSSTPASADRRPWPGSPGPPPGGPTADQTPSAGGLRG